jgi:spore maturation protein CgeB
MGHTTFNFDPTIKYKYSRTTFGRRLHQLNHLVVNILTNTQYYRERRKKRLFRFVNDLKIDLTITTHDFLYPDEITLIKEKWKSPIVMWFPDAIGNANKSLFMLSDYNYVFFQDPYAVYILNNQYNKKNVLYMPECCNPQFHKTIILNTSDNKKYNCDISTYGNPHNFRSYFFSQLLEYNYKIKIWGHQPPFWQKNEKVNRLYKGEYLVNEEKAKSVLASKINLNTLVPGGIYGLNARAFEIAGIGGFQLIHWRPGLADLFDDGKELVSFKNFNELLDKIKYYMNNDKERLRIAESGQRKAYSEHTFSLRLDLILETVFGNAKGFKLPSSNLNINHG